MVVTTSQTISSDSMVRKGTLMVISSQLVHPFPVATDRSPLFDFSHLYFQTTLLTGNSSHGTTLQLIMVLLGYKKTSRLFQ